MIETLAGIVTIVAGAYGFWRWVTRKRPATRELDNHSHELQVPQNEVYALIERFVEIYKAHGIEKAQIPRLIGKELA